jgi:hypothetical protein
LLYKETHFLKLINKEMKAKNINLYVFLFLLFLNQINSLSTVTQEIVHIDSEYAKVCPLEDKGVKVISTIRGLQKSMESQYDLKGNVVYGNFTLNQGYSASAQLVQPLSANGFYPKSFLSFHNKQNINGHIAKENIMEFNQGVISKTSPQQSYIYQQKSVVALKSGKVLVAGIRVQSTFGASTLTEVNIYDPKTGNWGTGITFEDSYSKYISCYEQKANEVYCFYVSWEHVYVSKMRIKHIKVNSDTMTLTPSNAENKKVVKNFYTVFSFIKAVPYNDNEAVVVFQTGNGEKDPSRYGNSGKDLYYYHLVVNGDSITVKRYEYLYDKCEKIEDPEDYKVDVAVLSEYRVYVVCETGIGRFRGFILYKDRDDWDEFNFNNFEAETVRNPAFVKFDKTLGIFYTHIGANQNSKVAFHLMNYPDCTDYRDKTLIIPRHYSLKDFDFVGKVFMNNPYPASRADEEISIQFEPFTANITLTNSSDEKIVPKKNYTQNLVIDITPNDISESEENSSKNESASIWISF